MANAFDWLAEFTHQLVVFFEFNSLSDIDAESNANELIDLILEKYAGMPADKVMTQVIMGGVRNMVIRKSSHPRHDYDAVVWASDQTDRLQKLYGHD